MSEIPPNKPDAMLSAEWVAMHREISEPRSDDPGFLGELRAVVIELAGWRMDIPSARMRLAEFLRGHPVPGIDPSSWQLLNEILDRQVAIVLGARDKFKGATKVSREQYPAWRLVTKIGSNGKELRRRWAVIGGKTFEPLIEDPAGPWIVALKDDPVWAALGDRTRFPDALGIDHPPFYLNSDFMWTPLGWDECVCIDIIESRLTKESFRAFKQRCVARLERAQTRLDLSVKEAAEEYAKRDSFEYYFAREINKKAQRENGRGK